MKTKILVTGATGVIGTALIKKLLEEKAYDIIGLDDYSVGTKENEVPGVKYIKMGTYDPDLGNLTCWKDIKFVFHLGEYSKITPSFEQIDTAFTQNIIGSFNLIRLCQIHEVRLIYAASSTKLSEEGKNSSPYAFFKGTTVELIEQMRKWFGNLSYNICYFNNVYGPGTDLWGEPYTSVINVFRQQKLENKPLTIYGDGNQERDFTHINDLTKILIRILKYGSSMEEWEIGSGVTYSILQIAKAFNHPIIFKKSRKGERTGKPADLSKIRNYLTIIPKYNVIKFIKENY